MRPDRRGPLSAVEPGDSGGWDGSADGAGCGERGMLGAVLSLDCGGDGSMMSCMSKIGSSLA